MKWIIVTLTFFFFSCTTAQKSSRGSTSANALLWEISGNGLSSPSYVYGTIHTICKDDFIFSPQLEQKAKAAKNIYLELDMDDPMMMIKMGMLSFMKDKTLKELMNKEEYNLVSAFVEDSLDLPMKVVDRMKPIAIMSLLYTKILPCKEKESYEIRLMDLAQKENKNIKGLETIEDQMAVFNKIPDTTQVDMIVDMIRNMDQQRTEFAEMVNAYKKQDLNTLLAKMSESPEWKGFEDIMLVNRNKNWIGNIETAMKDGTQLFAVGAGHLPGKEGVLNLLRAKGYKLTPMQ